MRRHGLIEIVIIVFAVLLIGTLASAQTSTATATATATPTPTSTPTPTATSTATPHAEATAEMSTTSVRQIVFTWTSGGAGTATVTTSYNYDGQIIGLETIPAGGGSAPTDNYDITITDSLSTDVLFGSGANRDTANTEYVTLTSSTPLGAVSGSKLTLNVTNAGSIKAGTVILYIR